MINEYVSGAVKKAQIIVEETAYEDLTAKEEQLIGNFEVPSSVEFELTYKRVGNQTLIQAIGIPLVALSGKVKKVSSLKYRIEVLERGSTSAQRRGSNFKVSSTGSSPLKNGNWHRVGVTAEGVYKLDYNYFNSIGIDPGTIDPRNIRVFGNSTGMLPESTQESVAFTLTEAKVQVVGQSDGKFDSGDYLLFYSPGPHIWKYDESTRTYRQTKHLYSDTAFYFISVDLGAGLRIPAQSSSGAGATDVITTYQNYVHHELDTYQLNQSGKKWIGERFTTSTSAHTLSFNLPNLNASFPLYVNAQFAASSVVGSGNRISATLNGTSFFTTNQITPITTHYTASKAFETTVFDSINTSASSLSLKFTYSAPHSDAKAYIDYITLNGTCNLVYNGSPMRIRNRRYVGAGKVGEFVISSSSDQAIWEITNPLDVRQQSHSYSGGQMIFKAEMDSDRVFYIFDRDNSSAPFYIGKVNNQNLLSYLESDYIIIFPELFRTEAEELAAFHRDQSGLKVNIASTQEVYNEFSSGSQDISAIRNFMKYLYDNSSNKVKYLMLLGDGSFDPKNRVAKGANFIPTFQSEESYSPLSSFASDDYYGMLDEVNIYTNTATVDIAIGRFPGKTKAEVLGFIQKLKAFMVSTEQRSGENCCTSSPIKSSFGKWKMDMLFVADDGNTEDAFSSIHLIDTEKIIASIYGLDSSYNARKLYVDAYKKQSGAGGGRYPEVERIIRDRIQQGSRFVSYIGHGGGAGWADEKILGVADIRDWQNIDNLSIFLTATCEFSRFDDPTTVSAGEWTILNPSGGAVAMLTTVRLVYGGDNNNTGFSVGFFENALDTTPGVFNTIGEAVMKTKIQRPIGANFNNRKFVLLGDPAMPIGVPRYKVVTRTLKDEQGNSIDTLKALQKVVVEGEVQDQNGNLAGSYEGILFPTIYDGEKVSITLDNNNKGVVDTFIVQNNILFKGKASVTGGKFRFEFIVPKDISYNYSEGKIGYYVANMSDDGKGFGRGFKVGGTADNIVPDNESPELEIYLNDSNFVNGGLVDSDPLLIVNLSDQSGINTAGNGLGHDMVMILDGDVANGIVLNEYYEANLDDYTGGKVTYPLQDLTDGPHELSFKAWDIHNNSAQAAIQFTVSSSATLALQHVLNYPNPFTTKTNFYFEHNHPCNSIDVQIKIFTISGKLIKTITATQSGSANLKNSAIAWDGKDDFGDAIGRGVYLYQLEVQTDDGLRADKMEKLVILK